jgi:hypothetical protein
MSFSPNLFLSNVRAKDGLAKTARFEVVLPIPPYINQFIGNSVIEKILNFPNSIFNDVTDAIGSAFGRGGQQDEFSRTSNASVSRYLALQCESAELPGKSLATADVKIYGPTFKVPYQTQYTDTTLTLLCTNDFYERKLFDRWTEAIMPSDTNNLRYAKDNATRYMTNIKIIQYDEFIKQIYAVELIDAFPIGIAAQGLSWSDEAFHRLQVQFAYQKYRVIYDGNYDLAAAATSLFGSAATRLLPFGNDVSRIFTRPRP